jgi:ABC-2 type transport system permease protein
VQLGWAVIAWVFVVGMLGQLLDLPSWLIDLSPYAHLPLVPGQTATPGPLIVLVAVAAALTGIGAVGMRRRDLVG